MASQIAQGWQRVARPVLLLAFALAVILVVLPLPPHPASNHIDGSWSQALHVATLQRLAFGTEIMFTYGPLGFVHARMYWPGLFTLTIGFWLVIALALLDAWRGVARGGGIVAFGSAAMLFLGLAFASVFAYDAVIFVYLSLWVWSVEANRPDPARLLAHGLVLGLIALSKLTFGLAGLFAAGMVAALLVVRGSWRHAFVAAGGAVASFLAGWVLLGQSLAALPGYLANGMQIVVGYGEAMSLRGPVWEMRAFGFGLLGFVGVAAFSAIQRRDPGMLSAVVFTLACSALAWKQAFTRHDEHAFIAFAFGCAAAASIASRFAGEMPRRSAAIGLIAASMLGAALYSAWARGHSVAPLFSEIVHRPLAAADSLRDAGGWAVRHEQTLAAVRSAHPLPRLPGTVDVYSHDQAVAFAHGLRWQPRPVFQSYSAYTGPLAAANRAHLEGPRAPDHVLMRVQAIDGRFPALEDGASWLPLLERYQVREEGSFLVLDRAPHPRRATRRPLPPWRGKGWLELPTEGALIVAAIEADPPPRGLSSIFKGAPMLDLEVRVAGEAHVRKYRFVRSAAHVPFVLSPLVESQQELADLFLPCGGTRPGRRIEAARILDARGRELEFRARLEVVDSVPGFPRSEGAQARAALCQLRRVDDGPDPSPPILGDDAGRGLNVHPPTRLTPRAPVRGIEFCTRVARPPHPNGNGSDGYTLQLVRVKEGKVVASKEVGSPEVSREACVAARFPERVSDLEIRIDAGREPQWDWVYVSRLKLAE